MTCLLNRLTATQTFALWLKKIFLNHLEENRIRTSRQGLLSSFSEFGLMLNTDKLHILALTETWLRDDKNAINYVKISGYDLEINNRNTGQRAGGVGFYIKDKITYKRRQDIINIDNIAG